MVEIQHMARGVNLKMKLILISLSETVGCIFYQPSMALASSEGMMR